MIMAKITMKPPTDSTSFTDFETAVASFLPKAASFFDGTCVRPAFGFLALDVGLVLALFFFDREKFLADAL